MTKLYALRHRKTGKLVGVSITANGDDADFCNSTTVRLCEHGYGSGIWVTDNIETAGNVMVINTPWYNSDMETPVNPFLGELDVVEFSESWASKPDEST